MADAVRRALGEVRPELVLTVGSDGLTGHPDHVAIGAAVREAADGVVGARVRAADVGAAQDRLKKYAGERQVGSGRVVGVGDEVVLEEIPASAWEEVEERRRRALDVYRAGLGTLPLEDVIEQGGRLGDSVLLRAVLDVAGWDQDLFERS